jgi:hypothetical protein
MKTAIITNIFGPLEINRLALIIKEVAAGSLTPIEPYIFSNTGTTFHNMKAVINVATVNNVIG